MELDAGDSRDKIEYQYLDFTHEQLNYMDPSLQVLDRNSCEPPIDPLPECETPLNVQNTSINPHISSTSAPKSAAQPQAQMSAEQIVVNPSTDKMFAISEKIDATFQLEVDAAADMLLNGTGLEGNDLFRCGFENCVYSAIDAKTFNVHIVSQHSNAVKYKCFHCKETFETLVQLKYHIKEHGKHRFFCYYCDHTAPLYYIMQSHFSELHKNNKTEWLALNPTKRDIHSNLFVVYPCGTEENKDFGMKLINRMHEMRSTKKFYAPDEVHLLPHQNIFGQNVHCKLCGYVTKVRTNMQRHLSMNECSKSRALSVTDPVNPVHYLNSGKNHFDQMLELDVGSVLCSESSSIQTVCQFVQEDRRFVCGGNSCQLKAHNEEKLRAHLNTFHDSDQSYSCPHCNKSMSNPNSSINIDEIIYHLRLHDTKVFKCPKCNFCNALKIAVDKHINEVHPKCKDKSVFIFHSQGNAGQEDANKSGKSNIVKWKCLICKALVNKQSIIQQHITETHHLTSKYQCDLCTLQTDNRMDFADHFATKHLGDQLGYKTNYIRVEVSDDDDVTPLWRRNDPNRTG